MTETVTLPIWLLVLILLFAGVTFASHFLFPSVRRLMRRRAERVVAALNARLQRPIQPFKLVRRYDLIQRLTYDRAVVEAVLEHARETGVPEDVAFETARRYAREIVPAFSATAYFGLASRMARGLSQMLYDVDEQGADLAGIDPDATVVFVMNHRSNMDYVLVTYLVAPRTALSYAVGEWARVWPLSALIRAMGAYFIRRQARDALYRRVLSRYVQMATEAGVAQAIYPEGGLSRDGRLGAPKVGLLKYLLEGAEADPAPIVFVPVALNYDRVLEDENLVAGADRPRGGRFDARISVVLVFVARLLWLRLRGVRRRYGPAAVRFGRPIRLEQGADMKPEALAELAMSRIAEVMPVLPVPLVALALAEGAPLGEAELLTRCAALLARLGDAGETDGMAAAGLERLVRRGILRREEDGRIGIAPGQAPLVAFYANSIASRFETGAGGVAEGASGGASGGRSDDRSDDAANAAVARS